MNTKNTRNAETPWAPRLLSAGIIAAVAAFGPVSAFAQAPTNPPGVDARGQSIGPDSTRPGPPSSRRPGAAGNANQARGATYSGMVPSGTSGASFGTADLAGAMRRAAAMRQAARLRARSAPSQARASYRSAEASLLGVSGSTATTGSGGDFALSAPQAAGDIRAIQGAARRARQEGRTREASRLRTMATRYAAGARDFFTGEMREALFAPAALPAVVIRGDRRAAPGTRAAATTTTSASRRGSGNTARQSAPNGAGGTPLPAPPSGPVLLNPATPPVIVQDPNGTPDGIIVVAPPPVVQP